MISLHKYKIVKLIGVACALLAIGALFNGTMHYFVVKEKGPKVDCSAFFATQTEIQTDGVMTLHLDGMGHGRINLSAAARNSTTQKNYNLLRDINFNYTYEGEGYLSIKPLAFTRTVSDDMPDDLFNRAIFDTSGETRRLRITKLKNGYIIWNAFSPALMCIQSD
ncbi:MULTISPECIES: hypothetical protein [Enterobacter]|uniref:hypothetical protein n=1 Tax=Enterobacter TaxID=547 RepID=UPI002151DF89|nr:hypothetical protein [Enterobacter sp. HG048]MCR6469469.1 hypothetical protein [Enterobacter sp. HG048]